MITIEIIVDEVLCMTSRLENAPSKDTLIIHGKQSDGSRWRLVCEQKHWQSQEYEVGKLVTLNLLGFSMKYGKYFGSCAEMPLTKEGESGKI